MATQHFIRERICEDCRGNEFIVNDYLCYCWKTQQDVARKGVCDSYE